MSSKRKAPSTVIKGTAIKWGVGGIILEEGSRVKFTQNGTSFEGVITFIHEGIISSVAVLGHANTFIVPIRTLTLI